MLFFMDYFKLISQYLASTIIINIAKKHKPVFVYRLLKHGFYLKALFMCFCQDCFFYFKMDRIEFLNRTKTQKISLFNNV